MCLVRTLHFIAAINNFPVRISHIQGVDNSIADAFSRGQMLTFHQLAPDADATMTEIPDILKEASHLREQYGLTAV